MQKGGFETEGWRGSLHHTLLSSLADSRAMLCSGRQELFKCFDRTRRFLGNVFILVDVPIPHRFPAESRQTVWVCWIKTTSPRKKKKLHFQTIFTQSIIVFVLVSLPDCFQFYPQSPFFSRIKRLAKRHQNTVENSAQAKDLWRLLRHNFVGKQYRDKQRNAKINHVLTRTA